jgi:hypothetical protein
VDAVRLHHDTPPEAERVVFVGDEVEPAGDAPPFAQEDGPGGLRGGGEFRGAGVAAAASRVKVRDLMEDEGAQEPEVAARSGEDAVLAFGVPTGDSILEFGWAVEVDLLRALDGPVLEDAVAAGAGVALNGGRVGTAALEGLGDDCPATIRNPLDDN